MSVLEDSLDLVVWFETQPDCGTYKKDGEIAVALNWTVRSMPVDTPRRNRDSFGDGARVRRARRYVDRGSDQMFSGYAFGTKRNGAGPRFIMLYTPQKGNAPEAIQESTSEQMGRAVQATQQHHAEIDRMIRKLEEDEQHYVELHQMDRAFCVHDAISELRTFGHLTMGTLRNARKLGILRSIEEL